MIVKVREYEDECWVQWCVMICDMCPDKEGCGEPRSPLPFHAESSAIGCNPELNEIKIIIIIIIKRPRQRCSSSSRFGNLVLVLVLVLVRVRVGGTSCGIHIAVGRCMLD